MNMIKPSFVVMSAIFANITQLEGDLHNLEEHPDEHYTRTDIPESRNFYLPAKSLENSKFITINLQFLLTGLNDYMRLNNKE